MTRPPASRLWTLALFLAGWASGAGAANFQASAPAPPPAAATLAAQPLTVADILARADDDQRVIDQARRLLDAPDPAVDLAIALDAIAGAVDRQVRSVPPGQLRGIPVMRLESLSRQWAFNDRRLARWQATAQIRLAPYASTAVLLAQRRAVWAATRAQGILDGLPPALTQRVDTILGNIDGVEGALGDRLAVQEALKARASAVDARIRAGTAVVDGAIARIDRQLLAIDAPPLWRGLAPAQTTAIRSPVDAADQALAIEGGFAAEYREAGGTNQQALKLFHLLLIPLLLWLTVRARRLARASGGRPVPRALRRPVSTFLLLSMLAVLAFEPDAPLLVEEVVLLVALIPAARLIPGGLRRSLGLWPYVAVGLYIVDQLGVVVLGDAGLYRLFVLALSVLGLGSTLWLIAHTRLDPEQPGIAGRWLRPIVGLVSVLFGIAVLANVIGNVSLAETLTSGVVDSGYMALVLYAAAAAILDLTGFITHDPALVRNPFLTRYGPWLRRMGARALWLATFIGWGLYSLSRFRLLRPLIEAGETVWEWGLDIGEASVHVGDIVTFCLALLVAVYVARGLRLLLQEELPRRAALPRGVGNSVASLTYYAVLILGLLFGLSAAGLKLGQLAFLFGALGVGIGFGLQNVVNNFVSGVVMMIERPIQPGDVVDVAGTSGTVRVIGLRATIIRTHEGSDVVVPNGLLLSGNLTNWTMFDRTRRIEVSIGVAYGVDPARVIDTLEQAARTTSGISANPAPAAQLTGYGDSALQFALRAWTHDLSEFGQVRSDLLAQALAALDAAGVAIPFPQLDVHIHGHGKGPEADASSSNAGADSC